MPGQFLQSYWVSLEVAGSGDGVHESDLKTVEIKILTQEIR